MASRLHAHIGSVRQLEILLAVYDRKSITAAANALHLTQPTVSMQIKKLADAVGFPLYHQKGRTLQFTEAGLETVKGAREVLRCFERMDANLAALQGLTIGTLRLALVTTAKYFIPHLIGDFSRLYPNIDLQFKIGNREQIVSRLREGEDDFCVFSHPPESDQYELLDYLPNKLVAIAGSEHPLTREQAIPLAMFVKEPFLIREPGSGTRLAIERHIQQHNKELDVRMTIESNEAIKHSVMSGLGVSILSEHTLTFGGQEGLSILDVTTLPIVNRWYLARRKDAPLTPIAQALLEYIKDQVKN